MRDTAIIILVIQFCMGQIVSQAFVQYALCS